MIKRKESSSETEKKRDEEVFSLWKKKKLILDGIINGITNTINFIPQLFFLIIILSIIEDTGFINIIAILFNNFLNKIGISSNSLHSLFLATNCSAMAIMSTRTIKNEIERKKVIFLIPFDVDISVQFLRKQF